MKTQQFTKLAASIEQLTFTQKKRLLNHLKQSTQSSETINV